MQVVMHSRFILLVGMVAGCPRQAAPPPAATPSDQVQAPQDDPGDQSLPPSETEPPEPNPGPCADQGRLWDGKPENCSYEHGGCCYDSAADACAAAGCATDQCNVLESYPGQIACSD